MSVAVLPQRGDRPLADGYCEALLRGHAENFWVAAPVLPRELRPHMARIYAFCRTTDDVGDESTGSALDRLAAWREDVERCFSPGREPLHPVLVALADTVDRYRLPPEPFFDLISANEQDQSVGTYAAWTDLLQYCRRSAAPVGRMVLALFGISDPRLIRLSDDVCIGLQLANFAQDVSVDREKGRVYLLQREIEERGVRGAIEAMCDRAEALLASGRALEEALDGGLRMQVALYRLGGMAIVDAIRRMDYRTDEQRPELGGGTRLRLLTMAWLDGHRPSVLSPRPLGVVHSVPLPQSMTPAVSRDAARHCARIARAEAKNFYWGFIALPREQRTAIYGLYAFARQVDDGVDLAEAETTADADPAGTTDGGPSAVAQRRTAQLRNIAAQRERLRRCTTGDTAGDPVMEVLAWAMARYGIPVSDLDELIAGVEMDLTARRYASWDELETYCAAVASTVGRMCVRIFGFRDAQALRHAHRLGLAMQLTNILRDIREDRARGRVYLPTAELERFGLSPHCLDGERADPAWPDFVLFQSQRARELFEDGLKVVDYIPATSGACVLTMAGIYEEILGRIERDPTLPLRTRVSLPARSKLGIALRSWLRAG